MTATATRLLAFAGSLREASYNRRLIPGGQRSLLVLREALAKLGLIVVPQQVAVGLAAERLPERGVLADDRLRAGVHGVGAAVVRLVAAQAVARALAPVQVSA